MPTTNPEPIPRVYVITGATSGIGRETARVLARSGATLALVARNPAKAEETVRAIQTETGNPRVRAHIADLSSLQEVRRVASELLGAYPRIDVLINNAGAVFFRREATSEGIERTWALNVLSPFVLTSLLLGRLRASAPARVVNVASAAHERGRLRLDDPEGRSHFSGFGAYSQSKLALVMWTYELARRLEGSGVTVNALHPGFVATRFGRDNGGVAGAVVGFLAFLFGIRVAKGARTSIYLASSREVHGVTGQYFVRERPARSSARSYALAETQALWTALCARAGIPTDWVDIGGPRDPPGAPG